MAQPTGLTSGIWSSGNGSIFTLLVENGRCRGFYRTAHGRPAPDSQFALTGFANGDLIGLCVSWGQFHSLTTWCGRFSTAGGRPKLRMVWHYARAFQDKDNTIPVEEWQTVITQAGDYFWERGLTDDEKAMIA